MKAGWWEAPLALRDLAEAISTQCFNKANNRAKFDHWDERKPYCTSISMVWWPYRKFFRNSHRGDTNQVSYLFWPVEALTKKKVADLLTCSNLQANCLCITYREISKYRINIIFVNKQVSNYLLPSQKNGLLEMSPWFSIDFQYKISHLSPQMSMPIGIRNLYKTISFTSFLRHFTQLFFFERNANNFALQLRHG